MKYLIYVQGYKFYYGSNNLTIVDVQWCNEPVIELKNPKELYSKNLDSDADECGIVGSVFIPQSQLSHIVIFD